MLAPRPLESISKSKPKKRIYKMFLTLKAKIVCSENTEAILRDCLYSSTKLYNGLIYHLRKEYEINGKVNLSDSHLNALTKTLPRSKNLFSQSVQQVWKEVRWAYRSFFALKKNGKTKIRPPGFRKRTTLSPIRYVQHGFRIFRKNGSTYLTLQITYDTKNGSFEARLVMEAQPKAKAPGSGKVAVDLGETHLLACTFSDGSHYLISGRLIKSIRRYWQKVRRKVKPPSQLNPKMSRRYRQIQRKEKNTISHLLHIVSKNFVQLCVEKDVSEIAIGYPRDIREYFNQGRCLNQRLHAWPFAKLIEYIHYKAQLEGIKVYLVDEANTSQTCPICGLTNKKNRKSRGNFKCEKCGISSHADLVGAINIYQRAYHVSPLKRSSGCLAQPVVWRLNAYSIFSPTIHEPESSLVA